MIWWLAAGVVVVEHYARADEMVSAAASRWLESEYEAASRQFSRTQDRLEPAMRRVEAMEAGLGDLDWDTLDGLEGIAREEVESIVTKAKTDVAHLDKSMENGERRGEGLVAAEAGIAAYEADRVIEAGRQFEAARRAFREVELAVEGSLENGPSRWRSHFERLHGETERSLEATRQLLEAVAARQNGNDGRADLVFRRGKTKLGIDGGS